MKNKSREVQTKLISDIFLEILRKVTRHVNIFLMHFKDF